MEILYIVAFTLCFSAVSASYVIEDGKGIFKSVTYSRGSEFADVASRRKVFVDKTLFVKRVFEGAERLLITAPRRFGKSTNLKMLRTFLEIPADEGARLRNRKLFEGLDVCKKEGRFFDEHFGKYPVLFVDFTPCMIFHYEAAVFEVKRVLHTSYAQYPFLGQSERLSEGERAECRALGAELVYRGQDVSEANLTDAFAVLAGRLRRHFAGRKAVVLVDGYDVVTSGAMFYMEDDDAYERTVRLMTRVFEAVVGGSGDVQRVVLSGQSYISSTGLPGLGRKIERCRFTENHPFVEFYGFTEKETRRLFDEHISHLTISSIQKGYSLYDGYTTSNGTKVYSPYSILNFLQDGKAERFWDETGEGIDKFQNLLRFTAVDEKIGALLNGTDLSVNFPDPVDIKEVITLRHMIHDDLIEVLPVPDLVLYYMLEMGYLTYAEPETESSPSTTLVRIPNNEIKKDLLQDFKWHVKMKRLLGHPASVDSRVGPF